MTRSTFAPALVALLGAACSDPSVRIAFDIPREYQAPTTSVVLRILAPPPDQELDFSCDDLAFRTVSQELVRTSQVQEVTVTRRDELDISGIPRVGKKLFWMEALDRDGIILAAGCEEVLDIEGQVDVTVVGEPSKVVSSPDISGVESIFDIGDPLPERLEVFVNDVSGTPLGGAQLRWEVIGPGNQNQRSEGSATTEESGRGIVMPTTPSVGGPSLLDIHARWEQTPLPLISGFRQLRELFSDDLPDGSLSGVLTRTEDIYAIGRIGPQGQMGFVALGRPSMMQTRQALIAYFDPAPGSPPFRTAVSTPIVNAQAVSVISNGQRDVIFVPTDTSLMTVAPDGTVTDTQVQMPGEVVRIVPVGACDSPSDEALISFANGQFLVIDASGPAAENPFTDLPDNINRLLGSGCVSGLGDEIHRTVVFLGVDNEQLLVADTGVIRTGEFPNVITTVGFTPMLADQPSAILGANLDIEGVSIVRYRIAPVGEDRLDAEFITADPVLTFSRSFQGGDFDNDGTPDVAAILDFGQDDEAAQFDPRCQREDGDSRYRVEMILGIEHREQRLVGISLECTGVSPSLFVADFNGDGLDDILVGGRTNVRILTAAPVP